jgi:putative ABC transport system substrate-binding protein
MRRRDLLALLGGAAALRPLAVRAQQKAMPVIGFLGISNAALYASRITSFRSGLDETGYVEGQNLAIEYRWAEGHYD